MSVPLTQRLPLVAPERLVADLVVPRHFAAATFDTYRPDPAHPSQAAALAEVRRLAAALTAPTPRRRLGRRPGPPPALYLDGGFGGGKTHLSAALAHAVGPAGAYGTFVEYTHLVGALGFRATVDALAPHRLVVIDEFELDDPGDTLLMSRMLRELSDRGVAVAATSNTLPDRLGEGRFAAEDFLREIQALAARFAVVRIDGPDYRHREEGVTPARPDAEVAAALAPVPGSQVVGFAELVAHLARVHPSRYRALLDGVTALGLTGVGAAPTQDAALRLVVLVDRLYDADVPVLLGGADATALFDDAMLHGGYRKKDLRALSRLTELTAR